ncbi:polymorphic toxin-type HINT domain-containing protein [Paenibacillus sp. NPDC057967]|uniref:polymorphic toxin-type HINT domain-containing protein n=1 Tax=Paenibacillus sp. NPDC057967 TaxID=3346293 RepID=UPI0036DBB908
MKKVLIFALSFLMLITSVPQTYAEPRLEEQAQDQIEQYLIKFKDIEAGIDSLTPESIIKTFKHVSILNVTLSQEEYQDLTVDENVEFIEKNKTIQLTASHSNQVSSSIQEEKLLADHAAASSPVKIAVLDTGATSEEQAAGGASFISGEDKYLDSHGHGGDVIAAIKQNSPESLLYALKIFDQSGVASYSQIIEAIEWSIDNEIKIVNMSFSHSDYSLALAETMYMASEKGILLIAAAGDQASDQLEFPAGYNTVIAVGAVDEEYQLMPQSNRGTHIDYVSYGTSDEGQYDGTGIATANVTSITARYMAAFPGLGSSEINEMMRLNTLKLTPAELFGYGFAQFILATEPLEGVDEELPSLPFPEDEPVESDLPEFEGTAEEKSYLLKKYLELEAIRIQKETSDPYSEQAVIQERARLNNEYLEKEKLFTASHKASVSNGLNNRDGEILVPVNISDTAESENESIFGDDFYLNRENFSPNEVTDKSILSEKILEESTAQQDEEKTSFTIEDHKDREKNEETEKNSSGAMNELSIQSTNDPNIVAPQMKIDEAPFSVELYNENVSMLSGSLSISETDITLPGRNGLSFSLTRTYDTSSAQYFDMYYSYNYRTKYSFDYSYTISEAPSWIPRTSEGTMSRYTRSEIDDLYSVVTSGRYNDNYETFKTVYRATSGIYSNPETSYTNHTKENPINKKFPIGQGWTWNIPYVKTEGSKKYVTAPDLGTYEISGTALVNYPWSDMSYAYDTSITYLGRKSVGVLKSVLGTKIYFDNDGNAIYIQDKNNNYIGFGYSEIATYGTVLTSVSDAIGNTIVIEYPQNKVLIKYNNSTVTYVKGTLDGREVLNQVIDQVGRQTTYSYTARQATFQLAPSGGSKANNYTLLTKIVHPTGLRTEYAYESSYVRRKWGSSTSYNDVYRLASRKDVVTFANGQTKDFNLSTFVYQGDMGSQHGSSHNFSTKLFDQQLETTHSFNKRFINSDTGSAYYHTKSAIKDLTTNVSKVTDMTYDMTKTRTNPLSVATYYTNAAGQSSANRATESYVYDNFKNVTKHSNSLGAVNDFTYDSNRRLKSSIQRFSAAQALYTEIVSRTAQGDPKEVMIRANSATGAILQNAVYSYDAHGNVTEIQNKEQNRTNTIKVEYGTANGYNSAFPTKIIKLYSDVNGVANQQELQALYDKPTGLIQAFTDGKKNTSTFTYDKLDRLTIVTQPDGSMITQQYLDLQNQITHEDELKRKSYVKWNPLGLHMESGIYVAGVMRPQVKNEYDSNSRMIWAEDAIGLRTTFNYDRWGRVLTVAKSGKVQTTIAYDDFLATSVITDPTGYKVRETSDSYGRVIKREDGQGNQFTTKWTGTYDWAHQLLTQQDGKNLLTTYVYDPLGRLLSVKAPDNQLFQYSYNRSGNMIQMTYPDGKIVKHDYDQIGRLIKTTDPLNKVEKYTYDANGNVSAFINKKGQQINYLYNSKRDWLEQKSGPDQTIRFTYNLDGSRKTMQDNGTRTTKYFYESDTGYLDYIEYPDTKKIDYGYDVAGDLEQVILPFSDRVNYLYNDEKQIKQVNWNNAKQVEFSYVYGNMIDQMKYVNGLTHDYNYANGKMTEVWHLNGTNQLNKYIYSYDVNGNINKRVEKVLNKPEETYTFTYDSMNRLQTSSLFNESYTYDGRGNRLTLSSNSGAYIPAGNVSYEYDSLDRLVNSLKNGTYVEYKYDGDGLLVERKENNVTTRYYYSGQLLVSEGIVQSNNTVKEKASYLQVNGPLMREDGSDNKYYYMKNGHGDVVELRLATGAAQNSYQYDIWGNTIQAIEPVSNPFRYSGELWDNSARLQYLRARWYDPSLGRFINEDTYKGEINNPITLNLYTYVYNNPLIYTDPSGHCGVKSWVDAGDCVVDFIPVVGGVKSVQEAVTGKNVVTGEKLSATDRALGLIGIIPGGKLAAKGGKGIVSGIKKLFNPCNCFTAGTKVQTDEGEKNIEDIEVGDMVLAKDENNPDGELAYKEVTALYTNYRNDIIKLYIGDLLIETTDNHPFWVEGKGWVLADELKVGDKLQKADGSSLTIDKVEFVILDEPVMVYNFTVADFHTYYVTDLGIWVHNSNLFCGSASDLADSARKSKKIDGLQGVKVSADLIHDAAIDFVGKGAKVQKIDGGMWYVSKDGLRRVRTGQKSKGAYEANFETLDKNGNVRTNYHVEIE